MDDARRADDECLDAALEALRRALAAAAPEDRAFVLDVLDGLARRFRGRRED